MKKVEKKKRFCEEIFKRMKKNDNFFPQKISGYTSMSNAVRKYREENNHSLPHH